MEKQEEEFILENMFVVRVYLSVSLQVSNMTQRYVTVA